MIKGSAGPADSDPHHIDGLSGATITSNAITRLVQFWLSDDGYGRWLKKLPRREGKPDARRAGSARPSGRRC